MIVFIQTSGRVQKRPAGDPMKTSIQNPNLRLLGLLAAFIIIVGVLAVDRFLHPPAGSGIITIGSWLLLFGITGAILYDVIHYVGKPPSRYSYSGGPKSSQTGSGNPWVQKANRALLIFCLSLAYEILVILVLPVIIGSLAGSGTIGLPDFVGIPLIIGIPVFLLIMHWSQQKFVDAVGWLDPDLAEGYRFLGRASGGFPIPSSVGGPLSLSALLIVIYAVFLGWFFSGFIIPDCFPFLPASVPPASYPPLAGLTLAFVTAPALTYLIFRRKD